MYYWLVRHLREIFDKRRPKWIYQRIRYGFDVRDTWSLRNTTAAWLLPRLKMFKQVNIAYPMDMTPEEWDGILDKMIYACDMVANKDERTMEKSYTLEEWEKIQEGLNLLGEHFLSLWW